MAIGTITKIKATQGHQESLGCAIITMVGDSAYPTGGTANFEDEVRKKLLMGNVELYDVKALDGKGYVLGYDYENDKLKVYRADYDAVADGPLVEVPDTTNLSGVTFVISVTFA